MEVTEDFDGNLDDVSEEVQHSESSDESEG